MFECCVCTGTVLIVTTESRWLYCFLTASFELSSFFTFRTSSGTSVDDGIFLTVELSSFFYRLSITKKSTDAFAGFRG
jgi:hypothetical protein